MKRFLIGIILLIVVLSIVSIALAQGNTRPESGSPPVASLISVSVPDATGIVTVNGAAGAAVPASQIAIRNLYTEDVAYTQSSFNGSFSATIFGPGRTPFQVNVAPTIPNSLRGQVGSLPGGPGTIVYGTQAMPEVNPAPVTRLVLDGALADWMNYPESELETGVYGVRNLSSLYVGFDRPIPDDYAEMRIVYDAGNTRYVLTLDPRVAQTATRQQIAPVERPLETVAIVAIQTDAIELRMPLAEDGQTITLDHIAFIDSQGELLAEVSVQKDITQVDERNGIVYSQPFGAESIGFFTAGPVSQGASYWLASGRVNSREFSAGDELVMQLDVTMKVPELAESLVGLNMIGQIKLQPVIGSDGYQANGGTSSMNGWSTFMTASGLAIDNVPTDFVLGEAVTPYQRVIRSGDNLIFGLEFRVTLPSDLPDGVYVPVFTGFGQVGDGERFRWDNNVILSPPGEGLSRVPSTRLPLTLNVGDIDDLRLVWSLFSDYPSDGSRGIIADEDQGKVSLSNRVRFNSLTHILQPGVYSIEPYLLNQMPNAYDSSAAPLIPLLLPGGRLNAQVTLPHGGVDDLGSVPLAQSRLSTTEVDEKALFGRHSPLDAIQLTTLNPQFSQYAFEQYGSYAIRLAGNVEDIYGNRYDGGGVYHVLVAELLDLSPGTLSGTPFEVGDVYNPVVHLTPGVPADITITLTVYPLDGSAPQEQVFSGKANAYGYFYSGDVFEFEVAGEYVVDYEARYSDADGKLWAASMRGAGVIARAQSQFIARGRRGVVGEAAERSAWFDTRDNTSLPYAPYYSGDVVWIPDTVESGLNPVLQVQDRTGLYETWLVNTRPDYQSAFGTIQRLAAEDAMPPFSVLGGPPGLYSPAMLPQLVVNKAYAYVSAVRPDITLRQFIQGTTNQSLDVTWGGDDPFNRQIGAGIGGNQPGDYAFIFGGIVVRNPEIGIYDSGIYGSLAVTTDPDTSARVAPPYMGRAGGPSGGPLFNVRGEDVEMFFLPTGAKPGQVMEAGDILTVSGQVAPTLASNVMIKVTSPQGDVYEFDGIANAVGYFYDADIAIPVDQVGVWVVNVIVTHNGTTSAGTTQDLPPTGGLPGKSSGIYHVYVVEKGAEVLDSNRDNLSIRPGAALNFELRVPAGWTEVRAYHTLTLPGYVVIDEPIRLQQGRINFQYNPAAINRDFPSLEIDNRGEGNWGSDVVNLTFAISGIDQDGERAIRTRSYVFMHDQVVSVEGNR